VIEFQAYFDFINAIEKDVKSTYLISKEIYKVYNNAREPEQSIYKFL